MKLSDHTPCQAFLLFLSLACACNSLDGDEPSPSRSGSDGGGVELDAASPEPDAGPPPPPDGLVVRIDGTGTTPGTGFTECASHRDCALVNDGCALCCEQIAVRRELVNDYEQARADACDAAGLGPAPCDCAFDNLVPRCQAGQCTAVHRDEFADTCYSPERPDGAYDDGSVGCNCPLGGQQICIGAALSCEPIPGTGLFEWRAVEDGPCWPRPDECPDGTVVDDAQQCLARFSDCYRRDDGSFCGVGPELSTD